MPSCSTSVARSRRSGTGLDIWDAGELLCSGDPDPRQWLTRWQFCRGFLSGLVAPGDAGKTTLRLTQAIELAFASCSGTASFNAVAS